MLNFPFWKDFEINYMNCESEVARLDRRDLDTSDVANLAPNRISYLTCKAVDHDTKMVYRAYLFSW